MLAAWTTTASRAAAQRRAGDDLEVAVGSSHGRVSVGGIAGAIHRRKSCVISPIIAQRTGVENNLVEALSGVVRLALIVGVG